MKAPWRGFTAGSWMDKIDVRDFIQSNYNEYDGDSSFLEGPTERTGTINARFNDWLEKESRKGGVLAIDREKVSSLLSYGVGYLDREREIIVGLQTDEPLKRGINPFGGIRMARDACSAYGETLSDEIENHFRFRTTHNDGVFRVYSDEIKALRRSGLITGLPDAYGRGRIIGDYRRVALYGVDRLIEEKALDKRELSGHSMNEENIRLLEELYRQIDFLGKLKQMALIYGYDIAEPAGNGREAVQWTYFAYLAAIKEQNGAAMSLGRVSTFFDIYFQRDLAEGTIDEKGIQEIFDDFVLKLRCARQLRTPEYNELFAGDPMWITEVIGGMTEDGRSMVTRSSYRMLQTLYNLGPSAEPNLTILWSRSLPESFKRFCAGVSIDTDSIQYENDDLMRPLYGDDYAIACCVSAMSIGKDMQFFGARCNLAKTLLLAINGGRDELTGEFTGPECTPLNQGILDYETVREQFSRYMRWLCEKYVNTMNIIHYMHDKYAYEKIQMALHDTVVKRFMAFGIAGLSVAADSLSAIKHAVVRPVADERGIVVDYDIQGDFPRYGNDDDRVDSIAAALTEEFLSCLRETDTYRNAEHTLSILTITSNVVYGKKTGSTPDGRRKGEAFAPGANPMHNRETKGALASLNSVSKIPYQCCRDGVSCTFSITPETLGRDRSGSEENLIAILDGYFARQGHHINVNVFNRETLADAMEHPEKYPNLTIRVSGYAVNFHRLSREQQEEVISRTFFQKV
ncbi:formate C-acetyltransferase [Spirochaeta isovalerica]|uniref:Formate acetyltransferase n=1 Tax=Spirochaeta isovalerica TaxID=150 RepID=A0A841RCQ1_9SPIO|nr:formate C-acetyltransferase [Spirochaeta isovalerica]MBB6481446.1 formate C-acetyltransferase [Spirochaeta isovalerica]